MEQKFKRGNVVRVLFGHPMWGGGHGWDNPQDMAPEQVGKIALIIGSYWDRFSFLFPDTKENRDCHINDYSVIFVDDGHEESWKETGQLEFLEEGGEYMFSIVENPHFTEYKQKLLDKWKSAQNTT